MKRFVIALFPIVLISSCSSAVSTSTSTTEAEKRTVVAAVGDISCSGSQRRSGNYPCVDAEVAELVRGQQPDQLWLLGDIQYNSHTVKNFQENFGAIWVDLIPVAKPIAGNHEYAEGGARGYYATWTKHPKPGYYSFDINDNWFVVAMNTNDECRFVSCDKGSEQYLWLESELQKNANKCIIVMAHHPRYSSGVHGSSRFMKDSFDLMTQHGVDIFLSGHDHHYERFDTQPTQFVVGTGGKDLRHIRDIEVGSVFVSNVHHGALFMDIYDRTAKIEFISVDQRVQDETTINC
jgi:calcineurin-like phosphoesterase family protein